MSEGFSVAELSSLCREAAMAALRENVHSEAHVVRLDHFTRAAEASRA